MTATDSTTAPTSGFAGLGLAAPILAALTERGYTTPTPIQEQAIPLLLEGRDLFGIAQTGTGKTAAFALPLLQHLSASSQRPRPRRPRALVLAPTRELATQITETCRAYGLNLRLNITYVFGGVGQNPQVQALRRGIDILVATPGRLLDLMNQGHCDLGDVEVLILDEADRMLDMGFLPDVKRIVNTLPEKRQSLLFSATMPDDITRLAHRMLDHPERVEVAPQAATADRIDQSVWLVEKAHKRHLLAELLADPQFVRTLVFTRTKHGADRVARHLDKERIRAFAIHGNKSQNQRNRALEAFKEGRCHVLVATDIAARGIDVKDITHVVNFDLPNISESYVHRIGRTARAGAAGIAISFCDRNERPFLADIQKLIHQRIPVVGKFTMEGGTSQRTAVEDRGELAIDAPAKPRPRRPQRATPSRGAAREFGGVRKPNPHARRRPNPRPRSESPWQQHQEAFGAQIDSRDERQGQDAPRRDGPRKPRGKSNRCGGSARPGSQSRRSGPKRKPGGRPRP